MLSIPTGELIARYGGRGPRYTSYPPVPVWTEAVGPSDYEAALQEASHATHDGLAVYVHLPFCRERCWYCGCNVAISRDTVVADAYLDVLADEAALVGRLLAGRRPVTAIHLGGGTPNFLTTGQLERLMQSLRGAFSVADDAALDVEIDPRAATPERVVHLAGLGFTRMSFGVQDLDPDVGVAIGRRMDRAELGALIAAARGAGVHGINFDLMYGLPRQTPASLARTLEQVATLRPDRLALYGYAHVPWIRPQQKRLEKSGLPSPSDRVGLFVAALGQLDAAGYEAIGLDHFALPGDPLLRARDDGTLDRGFQGYTTVSDVDLIGLGASSIGFLRSPRRPLYIQNPTPVKAYERARGHLSTVRGWHLTDDDVVRARTIRKLLCLMEVRSTEGFDLWGRFPGAWDALAPFEADGLVVRTPGALRVTELGRHFLRPIAMHFDAYLPGETAAAGEAPRVYSQTV